MKFKLFAIGALVCAFASNALAVDLSWSGRYRVEGILLKNPTLSSDSNLEKSYILHHLIMEPKIVPQDGLIIKSRFDIFNNLQGRNQAGQMMGSYNNTNSTTTGDVGGSQTQTQEDEDLRVTELYMTWVSEFGGLIVGRMPMQFGLGIQHNAGNNAFDHWFDTRDAVLYRMVFGNITLTPGYAKIRESELTQEDDINEYLVDASYEDAERDVKMGVLYDHRTAPRGNAAGTTGNDAAGPAPSGPYTVAEGYNVYLLNFYTQRKGDNWNFGAEGGFQNGYTGLKVGGINGERVEVAGWGVALEGSYKTGNITLGLKTGIVSGDDPDTTRIEGYYFDRNYDIAMLMFNHVLGSGDIIGSGVTGSQNTTGLMPRGVHGLDNEVITNAIYAAPTLTLSSSDSFDWTGTFAYAVQQKQTVRTTAGTMDKNLGFEVDLGARYHPTERFVVGADLGMLFPGAAWTGPGSIYKKDFCYGVTTKAAINF